MTDLEIELCQSTYRLHMAVQMLKDSAPSVAAFLTEQVEKNREMLKPMRQQP
jgi:hypothetical protein